MKIDKILICFWLDKYNKEEDLYTKGTEEELRIKFQKNKCVTKEDLMQVIKWKFQGRLKGRKKRLQNLLEDVDANYIKEVSRLAFETENDDIRFVLFESIKGVGPAITSVILSFYDQNKYGVMDIHSWRELFGKEPNTLFLQNKYLLKFIGKLREISKEVGLSCRDIEKALFKKNYDES